MLDLSHAIICETKRRPVCPYSDFGFFFIMLAGQHRRNFSNSHPEALVLQFSRETTNKEMVIKMWLIEHYECITKRPNRK